MGRLDELLDWASERNLSEEELQRLVQLAISTNRVEYAVSFLVGHGPVAAFNLRFCPELLRQHSKFSKVRGRANRFRSRVQETMYRSNDTIVITAHAIDRLVERWGVPFENAESTLIELARGATPLSGRTKLGQEQWLCENGAVLVVKRDRRKKLPVCVTVLPAPEESDIYPVQDAG